MPLRRSLAALRGLALAAASAAALSACAPAPGGPPSAADVRSEQAQSRELLARLQSEDKIIHDRRADGYIDALLARVEAQRAPGLPPLRGAIVADADVNAFTTGGGYVFVNAGMLAALENEAQLAMVLAHEAAHVDLGHVSAGRRNRQAVSVVGAIAAIGGVALGAPAELVRPVVGLGAQAAVSGFTREQEREADRLGARYLHGAGWSVIEGARSFEVLRRLYGDGGGFLASHPASAERQQELNAYARAIGAGRGDVNREAHLRATRRIRSDVLAYLDEAGRTKEAAQVRRNMR
ncbi:M48 family metalloprotease [Rhodovulum sp. DZ06]|uniref:M48 family metalloprotease n=1 Tax=Rhodovulum sp. DZ06 TaxID=3425126 RepID=UPI003D345395